MKKLGIIIPFRDRDEHLNEFIVKITDYLDKRNFNYKIIIVHQDNAKLFNRGMLLNIGFTYAKKYRCDYVVFHDVDMVPIDVDYGYSDIPLHLSTGFEYCQNEKEKIVFDEYFGGVTLFPIDAFEQINGYSNKYWGWGYEDDDLLLRCKKKGISLDETKIKNVGQKGRYLKFNGVNAYIKGNNNINLTKNHTIFISFYPKNIVCSEKSDSDIYTIFSIPGYDFSISYTSFSRYNFCAFDHEKNVLYVNSNIKKNYKTNFTVVIDEKNIKVYQDGVYIGETNKPEKFFPYENEPNFYIGVGNPVRKGDPNFFNGYFNVFLVFQDVLNDDEIRKLNDDEIPKNKKLLVHYDTNHIENYELKDLSNNKNNGKIHNCEIINLLFDEYKVIKIPYRRKSIFSLLPHEENGFYNNKWKDQSTRWNQLRFYNEVSTNDDLLDNDGLSDLEFIEYGKSVNKKIIHINVGI